jgi:hypothetical protein
VARRRCTFSQCNASNRAGVGGTPYLHCEHFYCCIYTPSPILAKVPEGEEVRDFRNAQAYATHFDYIFVASPNPSGKVTNREFATFFNVLRCFDEDSGRITIDGSSAMKASNLVVYFISPPFSSRYNLHFEFKQ